MSTNLPPPHRQLNDQALKESAFDQAQVFPNPYYAYNTQETSSANRFVTIARLPENVTVRIFSMAGALVRVLNDENKPEGPQGQFMTWDLKNESGLPVASGLYIYHIEAHTLGKTKVLKSFIIQPKQKLRFF
jgi:flagellar hook assembly protein FlgD